MQRSAQATPPWLTLARRASGPSPRRENAVLRLRSPSYASFLAQVWVVEDHAVRRAPSFDAFRKQQLGKLRPVD